MKQAPEQGLLSDNKIDKNTCINANEREYKTEMNAQ